MPKARELEDAGQGCIFAPEEMTKVPDIEWVPPDELPDKLYGDIIGVDLETRDDGIQQGLGPGWAFEDKGYVVGYSIAADNFLGYLPIRHQNGVNLDAGMIHRWLNHVLSDDRQAKVGANIMYDYGWAWRDGVDIKGKLLDVQFGEALLDEHRWSYSLNAVAKNHLDEEKDETLLREAAKSFGYDPKSEMWRLPPQFVGPYAEKDADLALRAWKVIEPKLRAEGLWELSELEHDLIPFYIELRRRGVRVDLDQAERLKKEILVRRDKVTSEIKRRIGFEVPLWQPDAIAKALDQVGLQYMTTPKTGRPSIKADYLESADHWLTNLILEGRQMDKLAGTFIDNLIFKHATPAARIHASVHPLRSDDGGTVSGRLSYSEPNLQQIPSRTDTGKRLRTMFIPEDGEFWWANDYSQQEPRLLVHFAALTKRNGEHLPGALEAVERYKSDPDMSYHEFVKELTGLEYKAAKILNLARIYGRGVKSTALQMGKTPDEVKEMFQRHHEELPFVQGISQTCMERVKERGYIRSLLGRRSRFNEWELADWDKRQNDPRHFPKWKAKKVWPGERLSISRIHKALNSLIQPSAADQTKKAMLILHNEGLTQYVRIQVHDELCGSAPDERIAERVKEIMMNAVELLVPSKVDLEVGPSWGDVKTPPLDGPWGDNPGIKKATRFP